jgi:peptidylprolyl isomerase
MRAGAIGIMAVALMSASCRTGGDSAQSSWRPAPIADALEPAEAVARSDASEWRPVDPENLLVMELADGGQVMIELAPDFAPVHVANIRALARGNWWQGAAVYRVQDNYVVQWGLNDAARPLPAGVAAAPPAEYERPINGLTIRPLGYPDSYAPMTGHAGGWPVAYDPQRQSAWLAHCYGMVGAGRDLAPDTGLGGELYAVIGHGPRHLDRNIALVGRVVEGVEALSARPRGTEALGFYKERSADVPIRRVRVASDIPPAEQPRFEVLRSESPAFSLYVTGRANRGGDFFSVPAGGVDVCNVNVPVRRMTR